MSLIDKVKRTLINGAVSVEERLDAKKHARRRRKGYRKPLLIMPYNGLGNQQVSLLKGRVLQNRDIRPPQESKNYFQNSVAMMKRMISKEIPYLNVIAIVNGKEYAVKTDDEGYFHFELPSPATASEERLWYDVELKVDDPAVFAPANVHNAARVQIPSPKCDIGIISDIDDTVLQTNATNWMRMLKVTLLHNAHTRLPFRGVAAFYRALSAGMDDSFQRPLFFVSSSPWNIYDMLVDFMAHQDIPDASYFLRDLGLERGQVLMSSHHEHKSKHIDLIFQTYPDMQFILLGDSGQKDPEIFLDALKRHPEQIACIYIRDVSKIRRDEEVRLLLEEALKQERELVFVKSSLDAARHAAEKGYIRAEYFTEIMREQEMG